MFRAIRACAALAAILVAGCGGGGSSSGTGSNGGSPPVSTPSGPTPPSQTIVWSTVKSGIDSFVSPYFSSVAFGNGKFVVTSPLPDSSPGRWKQELGEVFTSSDGLTWTQVETAVDRGLVRVVFGQGQFVGYSAPGAIATSTDGTTWTQTMAPIGAYWEDLVFGAGTFLASGINSSGRQIYVTSTDGLHWTAPKPFPLSKQTAFPPVLAFGNGQIIAIPEANSDPYFATPEEAGILVSSDGGNSWTFKSAPGIFYPTFGNGKFVASRRQGSAFHLATSSDLVNWTNTFDGACIPKFAGSMFVADCRDGTFITSSNGSSWSRTNVAFRTSTGSWSHMLGVAFGNGVYVVAGWPGWLARGIAP